MWQWENGRWLWLNDRVPNPGLCCTGSGEPLKVFEQRNGMSQFLHWEINLDTMSGWFGGRRRKWEQEGDYRGEMASTWVGQRDLKRRDRWGRVLKDLVADRLPWTGRRRRSSDGITEGWLSVWSRKLGQRWCHGLQEPRVAGGPLRDGEKSRLIWVLLWGPHGAPRWQWPSSGATFSTTLWCFPSVGVRLFMHTLWAQHQ